MDRPQLGVAQRPPPRAAPAAPARPPSAPSASTSALKRLRSSFASSRLTSSGTCPAPAARSPGRTPCGRSCSPPPAPHAVVLVLRQREHRCLAPRSCTCWRCRRPAGSCPSPSRRVCAGSIAPSTLKYGRQVDRHARLAPSAATAAGAPGRSRPALSSAQYTLLPGVQPVQVRQVPQPSSDSVRRPARSNGASPGAKKRSRPQLPEPARRRWARRHALPKTPCVSPAAPRSPPCAQTLQHQAPPVRFFP